MPTDPRAARGLESALLFTFFAHGLGMLTMAAFLLPGMPGGPHLDIASRAAYVANHPWIWRAGWFGWQLTALSDLLLALALVSTSWIRKVPAIITLLVTILTLIPDQFGQAMWTWPGIHLAQAAVVNHQFADYAAFEIRIFRCIAGIGTVGYLTAAFGWTWCFASAGTWNRAMTRMSITTWGLFGISTAIIFVPTSIHVPAWAATITAAGNAVAFILLMIWFVGVTELVLRRSRPNTAHGHWAVWRHPGPGLFPRMFDLMANSRFTRLIGEYLPTLAMASDITNVIYINYLVPADTLRPLVALGLQLQTVGPQNAHAVFSILIYRHGHFGPSCFGSLRRIWPSPIQSNWRIYVIDPGTGKAGVQFITTSITSLPHALATRLLSEGVPMHIPASAELHRDATGTVQMDLDPGAGTSPDLHGTFNPVDNTQLPESWQACFGSWAEMLAYCVPQDRALASQPWYERLARQEIALGIPFDACRPITADLRSNTAESIVGKAKPLCFKVDRVAFSFLREVFDPRYANH